MLNIRTSRNIRTPYKCLLCKYVCDAVDENDKISAEDIGICKMKREGRKILPTPAESNFISDWYHCAVVTPF